MRGTATTATATAKVSTAPRQPATLTSTNADGNETVPANPATRVTSVIALFALVPMARVSTAKQAS